MKPSDQYDIAHMIGNKIISELPRLRQIWMELNRPPIQFNLISNFYRHESELYGFQKFTLQIVATLRSLAPEGHGFSNDFREVIRCGTGHEFRPEDNEHWPQHVGPIIHAFFHARCLLDIAIQCVDLTGLPTEFSFLGVAMLMPLFDPRGSLDIP